MRMAKAGRNKLIFTPYQKLDGIIPRISHPGRSLISAPNRGAFLILQPLPDQGANPLMLPSSRVGVIAVLVQPPRDAERQLPRILTGRPDRTYHVDDFSKAGLHDSEYL